MTAFQELYNHCQTLSPKVSTKEITEKALKFTGASGLKVIKDSLDTTKVRGYFLSANNVESPIVKMYGTNVIVLARGMKPCWDRFILTKELMHLFDEDQEKTGDAEQFKVLLREFEALDPEKSSPQFESEVDGFWKALACLCPEKDRLEFIDQFQNGHIDHYGIALKLRIPEQHVRQLFRPNYESIIASLLSN